MPLPTTAIANAFSNLPTTPNIKNMPLPIGALVAGGASLLGNVAQGIQNRRSQRFSEQMYDKQYKDSLEFWRMQNEYNTPKAQMQRLQEAGLNPALMYGQGQAGTGVAGAPKTPDVLPAQFRAPDIAGGSNTIVQAMLAHQDVALKREQVNQTAALTEKIKYDAGISKVQEQLSKIGLYIEEETKRAEVSKRWSESTILSTEANVADRTAMDRIAQEEQRLINMQVQAQNTRETTRKVKKSLELLEKDINYQEMMNGWFKDYIRNRDPLMIAIGMQAMNGAINMAVRRAGGRPTRSVSNLAPFGSDTFGKYQYSGKQRPQLNDRYKIGSLSVNELYSRGYYKK